jgi:hypothetical protein
VGQGIRVGVSWRSALEMSSQRAPR